MLDRGTMGAMALAVMLCAAASGARAFDDAKYPDLHGQWIGVRGTAGGGTQGYMLSADGYLMPTRRDQPPPDLKYFKQTQK